MDKKLYDLGDEVNNLIVMARGALASYHFYPGNKTGAANDADVAKLRDLLRDAEYLSRLLTEGRA